jgi:hypothetical protein
MHQQILDLNINLSSEKKNQITLHGYEINKNAYVKGKNKYP